ncbi:MAG: FtsX-like permease family protein [Anaeromyxobacteraceae bacterium]
MRRYLLRLRGRFATAALRMSALSHEFRAGRALFLLAVGGIALGVASVVSIQLLNRSALGAFAGTVRAVSGDADLTVLGPAGFLDEALLGEVLSTGGVAGALAMWRAPVALERPGGRAPAGDADLELVGADLVAPVRVPWRLPSGDAPGVRTGGGAPVPASQGGLAAALGTPGWVAVTPELAAAHGWKVGDRFEVSLGARRAALVVGALVDFRKLAPLASRRLAVMDIAQAQGLLGVRGRIHQIDVTAAKGVPVAELSARLQARLGERARVVAPEQRVAEASGLLAAFRLNLTALSLVSLLVGGFLVYASVRASLARRREELGILRAVGATRGQVLGLVLGEAALLGAAGTALGLPLGWLAAAANVGAVSGTLRNVYLLEGIERVELDPWLALVGLATGVAGAVAGAIAPGLDAARKDPRALLSTLGVEERARAGAPRLLAGAAAALLAGVAVHVALDGRWRPSGFALALGVLAAVPLAAPTALRLLARLGRPHRLGVSYGLFTLGARPSAASVATGALAVSVAMLAGVTVMVGSFRGTVTGWLDRTLMADVYVTTPSWRLARGEATLTPAVVDALRATPGLDGLDLLRQAQVAGRTGRVTVSGVAAGIRRARAELVEQSAHPGRGGREATGESREQEAFRRLATEGAALVSEPLARREGLLPTAPGATIPVRGPAGEVRLPVAGVYRDYGNEAGAVLVDLATFARIFGEGPPQNAALHLAPGADVEATVDALRSRMAGQPLLIRSNRTLRGEVLKIFDETFAVTRLLQAMGLLIAAAGVALSLLVLARERRGELALYRALGASRPQLFRVFVGRGLAIGAAGLAAGAAGGAGLAWVLVEVVNPAFFGWTLGVHVPWGALAVQAGTILAAAVAASLYPAAAASRTPVQELSRDAL